MTQQQLLEKLNNLLRPSGYLLQLNGDWQHGEVLANVSDFGFSAYFFTYNNLIEDVDMNMAYLQERIEGSDYEGDKDKFTFWFALAAALQKFSEEERQTIVSYTFNQHLFDFLKQKLASDSIEVAISPNAKDERLNCVVFNLKLPHLQFRIFQIYGRFFSPEMLKSELFMTREELDFQEDGDRPEYTQAINAIRKRVRQYYDKLSLIPILGFPGCYTIDN